MTARLFRNRRPLPTWPTGDQPYFANKRVLYQEVVGKPRTRHWPGIERARRRPTLMGRLAVIVDFAMEARCPVSRLDRVPGHHRARIQRHPSESDRKRRCEQRNSWFGLSMMRSNAR